MEQPIRQLVVSRAVRPERAGTGPARPGGEAHGGTIGVESAPSRSRFWFALPLTAPEEREQAAVRPCSDSRAIVSSVDADVPQPPRDPVDIGEEGLLPQLRAGQPEAFERFVRLCAPRALAVARRFLRNEHDAQDVVQEAFLGAFKALDGFKGGCRLSTWLHRIVVNAALMKLRTQRSRPEQPIEELLPQFLENGHHAQYPAEWQERADVLLERLEVRQFVRECIDQLPESHRTVLILRDIEELDTAEAAQLLGINETALKVRLHRARQALRTLLDPRFRRDSA